MNEQKTITILNQLTKVKLQKAKGRYCSYDAEDKIHIAEIKNRKSYYATKLIEATKLFSNYQKAQLKNKLFIYIVTDSVGLYVFNITKNIDTIINEGIRKNIHPAQTEFKNKRKIIKYYYALREDLASFVHYFDA